MKQRIEKLGASGRNFTQIVMELAINRGYAVQTAQRMVAAVLDHDGNQLQLLRSQTEGEYPDIDTSMEHNWITLADARIGIAMEQLAPRMVLLDNFLSDKECDALCDYARDHLESATVHVEDHANGELLRDIRRSDVTSLPQEQFPLISVIEHRIEALTGWPQACGEPLQIQRYGVNGKYEPHYDFFLNDTAYYEKEMTQGGQRLATLIVYLQQPERGGATYMANLGIRVMPRKGSALFFSYPQATRQSGTLHGGDPVHSGEKWIMTKWFREKTDDTSAGTP
ncbi:prolyl hydroxylase family protein [Undibacterium rugosum]|uniref:prolyl hydroxylase family protein n=1 Tax=Undibacterium rugosum TaxID=2762291 RepID=UPI001B822316|nr:2OG-Fe(II) oxygenase [Undibacterium rugosum]MBR7780378.1 2OG-Fe(II) oxygenase [Undibacterium rugosum]